MNSFNNRKNNRNNRNNRNNSSFSNKISNFGEKLTTAAKNANEKLQSGVQKATNGVGRIRNNINERVNNVKQGVSSRSENQSTILGKFNLGFKNISNTTRNFAEANSSITKVVFILFAVILFGLLLRLGIFILGFFMSPSENPIVINGLRPTTRHVKYNVNPNNADPKPILRSINENQGMEFTWSTWIWMDGINYSDTNVMKRIFSKGKNDATGNYNAYDLNTQNQKFMNSPGLYADPSENSIHVILNTFNKNSSDIMNDVIEDIKIQNIPVQKWVNIIIRIQNRTIDIYVNGTLTKRKNLDVVPKQNYGDIFVGDNINGMNGFISSLRYFRYAIGAGEIQNILYQGPNLKMEGNDWADSQPPYLAMRWYFDQDAL